MDLGTIAQLGIACAIAVGAKREMATFRTMFKETLDKLADVQNAEGERLGQVESRVTNVELAVHALAEMVEVEDEEDEVAPAEKEPAGFKAKTPVAD